MQYNKNQQCIEKILKWTKKIQDVLDKFDINDYESFEQDEICQLAINQLITNIHELTKKVDNETLNKMPILAKSKLGLKNARNISSHDYDSLDFRIVYRLVMDLLSSNFKIELEGILDGLKKDSTNL